MNRVQAGGRLGIAKTKYHNCGRHKLLSLAEARSVVDFVKQWRAKRFCTSRYIRQELKLKCSLRTIRRTLNAHGY